MSCRRPGRSSCQSDARTRHGSAARRSTPDSRRTAPA
nr:MAG TPA: hypothetical protein [Caudoviricetes sp.]